MSGPALWLVRDRAETVRALGRIALAEDGLSVVLGLGDGDGLLFDPEPLGPEVRPWRSLGLPLQSVPSRTLRAMDVLRADWERTLAAAGCADDPILADPAAHVPFLFEVGRQVHGPATTFAALFHRLRPSVVYLARRSSVPWLLLAATAAAFAVPVEDLP